MPERHPVKPAKGRQGVGRSFENAFAGLAAAVRTQRNMRIHVCVALLVLVASLLLGASALEMAVITLTIMIVFATELLNTALEFVVDLVTEEYHPLARLAKDVSAAAVLVTSLGAVVVGLLLLADDLYPLASLPLLAQRPWPGQLVLVALAVAFLAAVLLTAFASGRAGPGRLPSGQAAVAAAGWVAASFLAAGSGLGARAGLVCVITLMLALLVCRARVASGRSLAGVVAGAVIGASIAAAVFGLS